jgi:hypothetical protein
MSSLHVLIHIIHIILEESDTKVSEEQGNRENGEDAA